MKFLPVSFEENNPLWQIWEHRLESLFKKLNPDGDYRVLSHAFFASLNGIMITYRQYPGRDMAEVRTHMKNLASVISRMFVLMVTQAGPADPGTGA
ncbi:MAG: hypothetical protein V1793_24745 [Pseudomonadota bacterium]